MFANSDMKLQIFWVLPANGGGYVMRKSITLFLLSLLCAGVCSPQSSEPSRRLPSGVRGTVVHSVDHMPIRNAYVVAHGDGSQTVQVVRVSTEGMYSVELPPAIYDVCVMARSFSPTCRKIEVTLDGMMVFNPTLEVNPLGMQVN
jgi:hypothetical protein